jgi:hypothetical protein
LLRFRLPAFRIAPIRSLCIIKYSTNVQPRSSKVWMSARISDWGEVARAGYRKVAGVVRCFDQLGIEERLHG